MRTLTKERIDPSSLFDGTGTSNQSLVIDGTNEVIHKKLSSLQEANKKSLALSKQESRLKAEQHEIRYYAKRFISRYTKMFGISRENMKDLIGELKDDDIILLENTVLEKLRKPAYLQVIGSFSALGIFIGSGLAALLLPNNEALFVLVAMLFFTTIGWLLPLIFLAEFFYGSSNNGEHGANTAMGYIGSQRVFKKKYGPQYFPYQEVKEELGLVENDIKESYYTPKPFNH